MSRRKIGPEDVKRLVFEEGWRLGRVRKGKYVYWRLWKRVDGKQSRYGLAVISQNTLRRFTGSWRKGRKSMKRKAMKN